MSDFKPSLLLHVCCAPCAAYVIEKLQDEFEVTAFFYNPNIHPLEEYIKRVGEIKRYGEDNHIDFIEYRYDPEVWFKATEGLENEPEGGQRCSVCFWQRLDIVANYADTENYDFFGTTLTVSKYKNSGEINKIGRKLSEEYGLPYLDRDFKEDDGFRQACDKAKEKGFYRQNYCGCLYSKEERQRKKAG
ncbi:MAG: epoxyqueuosine reductase QueH [Patescibacteria group bacterium]